MSIQVSESMRKDKLQLPFDKRMTGSTAIDEVLQEVRLFAMSRHIIITLIHLHCCSY